jgi:hypothetical protein
MQGWSRTLSLMACGASLFTAGCASRALAQDSNVPTYPKLEYYAGYFAIETNNHTFLCSEIRPVSGLDYDEGGRGVEAAVIGNVSRYFSIVGDFSAHLSYNQFLVPFCKKQPCPTAETQNGTINPKLFDFLAGPEVKWRNHTRFTPFANALFGLAHSTATFSTTGSLANISSTDAESGFAMSFNAGFDLRIIKRIGFRGSLNYSQAFVGSDVLPRQQVDAVGWSTGILFH